MRQPYARWADRAGFTGLGGLAAWELATDQLSEWIRAGLGDAIAVVPYGEAIAASAAPYFPILLLLPVAARLGYGWGVRAEQRRQTPTPPPPDPTHVAQAKQALVSFASDTMVPVAGAAETALGTAGTVVAGDKRYSKIAALAHRGIKLDADPDQRLWRTLAQPGPNLQPGRTLPSLERDVLEGMKRYRRAVHTLHGIVSDLGPSNEAVKDRQFLEKVHEWHRLHQNVKTEFKRLQQYPQLEQIRNAEYEKLVADPRYSDEIFDELPKSP